MNFISKAVGSVRQYIRTDWASNRVRFCTEVFAWACSVVSAVMFAATVPNIPVVPLYTIFIAGCFASAWACWTRRSFWLDGQFRVPGCDRWCRLDPIPVAELNFGCSWLASNSLGRCRFFRSRLFLFNHRRSNFRHQWNWSSCSRLWNLVWC